MRPRGLCLLIWIIVIPGLCYSCRDDDYNELLKIESVLEDSPERALSMLKETDTSRFSSPNNLALYQLLFAAALDKNNIDDGSFLDEAETAADWFHSHGKAHRMPMALYYWGDQLYDRGEYERAIEVLTKSLDLALKEKDWFYAGMSARMLGNISSIYYEFQEEAYYFDLAVRSFNKAEKPYHAVCANLSLAMAASSDRRTDQADSLFELVMQYARQGNDTVLLRRSYSQYARHLLLQRPDSLKRIAGLLDSTYRIYRHSPTSDDMSSLALFYARSNKDKFAENYLDMAFRYAATRQDSVYARYSRLLINQMKGNNDISLLEDSNSILQEMDHVSRQSLRRGILRHQNSAYYDRLHAEKEKGTKRVLIGGLIILALLFLGGITVKVFIRKLKEAKEQNQLLAEDLNREREAVIHLQSQMKQIGRKSPGESFPGLVLCLKAYERLCSEYIKSGNDSRVQREFNLQLKNLQDAKAMAGELRRFMSSSDPDLLSFVDKDLEKEIGTLSNEDKIIVYSVIAKLPTAIICAITGRKKQAVRTQLFRIKKRIDNCSGHSKILLLPYFEERILSKATPDNK